MTNSKDFTTALLFSIIMIVCIIVNCRSIFLAKSHGTKGAMVFSICALAICSIALVFDIVAMINSY